MSSSDVQLNPRICPLCALRLDTERVEEISTAIRRVRICPKCGGRMKAIETAVDWQPGRPPAPAPRARGRP